MAGLLAQGHHEAGAQHPEAACSWSLYGFYSIVLRRPLIGFGSLLSPFFIVVEVAYIWDCSP